METADLNDPHDVLAPDPLAPQSPMVPEDLRRLGPLVIQRLRQFLPFGEAILWDGKDQASSLPPASLSPRQQARAMEALDQKTAFWDRVGNLVLIPLIRGGETLGTLVLTEVWRTVAPEEGERWLPLLQTWIRDQFQHLRHSMLHAQPGDIPPYVRLAVETRDPDDGVHMLVHLIQKKPVRAEDRERQTELCARLLGPGSTEWLGHGPEDSWLLVTPDREEGFAEAFRRLMPAFGAAGRPLCRGFAHRLRARAPWGDTLRAVRGLEAAAAALGTRVLSTPDLEAFEARLGLSGDLASVLDDLDSAVRRLGRSRVAVGYIRGQAASFHLDNGEKVEAPSGGGLFVLERLAARPGAQPDLAAWGKKLKTSLADPASATVGIAASWQPSVGAKGAGPAALWACLHASMLGEGTLAIHDALTWNVRGDEILGWGDMSGACRAYRQGLQMAPQDGNLLNSLGTCLAETGQIKTAIRALDLAAQAHPEDFMAFYNLGGLHLQRRDPAMACRYLEEAFARRPEDLWVAVRYGEALLETGRPDRALEILEPFGADPSAARPSSFHKLFGVACERAGRGSDARRAWQEAIRINPADGEALASLALNYLREGGDCGTALRFRKRAEALTGGSPRTQQILAEVDRHMGEAGCL